MRVLIAAIAFCILLGAPPVSAQSTEQHFAVIDALVALVGDLGGVSAREGERQLCQDLLPDSASCLKETARRQDQYDKEVRIIGAARQIESLEEREARLGEATKILVWVKTDFYRWAKVYFPDIVDKLGGRRS